MRPIDADALTRSFKESCNMNCRGSNIQNCIAYVV